MLKRLLPYAGNLLVLVMALVMVYDHLGGHQAPAPAAASFLKLGKDFAAADAAAYGDGCLAAAAEIEKGGRVEDAQAALQAKWSVSHRAAFMRLAAPEFEKLLPAGAQPSAALQAEYAAAWAAFGRGLKGESK